MAAVNIGTPTVRYTDDHQPIREWVGNPLYVSNSEIQTWKQCKRKWYLAYVRRLGLKAEHDEITGPRSLGTRIHMVLDHYFTEDGVDPVAFLRELYEDTIRQLTELERATEDVVAALWKEYDLGHAMLTGFLEWLAENGIDSGIEVVDTEAAVVAKTHIPGVFLRGKLDQRIVRASDGARLFRDWKTVGDLTTPTKTLHMDEQMKFYHLLEYLDAVAKIGGEAPWRTDGALYMMLRRVKRTANAKPPFYGQLEVHHNKATVQDMWIRTTKVIEEMFDAHYALQNGADHHYVTYPSPNRDCTWKCDFFPVCPMFDDGSNAEGMLELYYAEGDPNARYETKGESNG